MDSPNSQRAPKRYSMGAGRGKLRLLALLLCKSFVNVREPVRIQHREQERELQAYATVQLFNVPCRDS